MSTQLPGKASLVGHRVKATCSGWVLWELLQREGSFHSVAVAKHTWAALPRENESTFYEASLGFQRIIRKRGDTRQNVEIRWLCETLEGSQLGSQGLHALWDTWDH